MVPQNSHWLKGGDWKRWNGQRGTVENTGVENAEVSDINEIWDI